jgi:hypothetical protein
MSDRITSMDFNHAVNKLLDTLKARHGREEGYMYAYATISGILCGCSYAMDEKEKQIVLNQLNNKIEETMHQITLESLRAKETA